MDIKHTPPRARGFAPDFKSLTISLLKPMADIAITIKNFDKSLKGLKNPISTPWARAIVVIKLARTKYIIKNGKICFIDIFLFFFSSAFFILIKASPKLLEL